MCEAGQGAAFRWRFGLSLARAPEGALEPFRTDVVHVFFKHDAGGVGAIIMLVFRPWVDIVEGCYSSMYYIFDSRCTSVIVAVFDGDNFRVEVGDEKRDDERGQEDEDGEESYGGGGDGDCVVPSGCLS